VIFAENSIQENKETEKTREKYRTWERIEDDEIFCLSSTFICHIEIFNFIWKILKNCIQERFRIVEINKILKVVILPIESDSFLILVNQRW